MSNETTVIGNLSVCEDADGNAICVYRHDERLAYFANDEEGHICALLFANVVHDSFPSEEITLERLNARMERDIEVEQKKLNKLILPARFAQ